MHFCCNKENIDEEEDEKKTTIIIPTKKEDLTFLLFDDAPCQQ